MVEKALFLVYDKTLMLLIDIFLPVIPLVTTPPYVLVKALS